MLFKKHQHCSDATWRGWKKAFLDESDQLVNVAISKGCIVYDKHPTGNVGHCNLMSYFYDNCGLKELCSNFEGIESFPSMLSHLDTQDPDQTFSFETDFNHPSCAWHDNTWTKRLCEILNSTYSENGLYKISYT